jgi:deazaflavin-dependent oxidoreductase (nitroreductase family)
MTKERQFDPAAFNQQIIDEFRVNGGKVGGMFAGAPMILLTTIGAKTGKSRTVPLVCLEIDGRQVVVGSKGGADTHPAWYHNIRKNPEVTVESGTEKYTALADVVPQEERDRLFAKVAELAPGYGDYQAGTKRIIPVVTLVRA